MMQNQSKGRILFKLFLSTFYISSFTFGGGFVIITLMKRKFVDKQHWIDADEMLDITALAQSSPGAIAVNASILVGWRIAGIFGMVVAVCGTILPPLIILSVISVFYNSFVTNSYVQMLLKGMQAGVAAVILDVTVNLGTNVVKLKNFIYILIMIIAFVLTFFCKFNVIYIILAAAVVGIVQGLIKQRRSSLQ